jgi:hypothetical protein
MTAEEKKKPSKEVVKKNDDVFNVVKAIEKATPPSGNSSKEGR